MDLDWQHQIHMTRNFKNKLEALGASSCETLKNICTAIIPSLAYAFAVTPHTPVNLIIWDNILGGAIKHKF